MNKGERRDQKRTRAVAKRRRASNRKAIRLLEMKIFSGSLKRAPAPHIRRRVRSKRAG